MHEKNAKPSKVREESERGEKGYLCEEKLAVISFFLMPGLLLTIIFKYLPMGVF